MMHEFMYVCMYESASVTIFMLQCNEFEFRINNDLKSVKKSPKNTWKKLKLLSIRSGIQKQKLLRTDFDGSNLHCATSRVPNRWMMVIVGSTNSYYFCKSAMDPFYCFINTHTNPRVLVYRMKKILEQI